MDSSSDKPASERSRRRSAQAMATQSGDKRSSRTQRERPTRQTRRRLLIGIPVVILAAMAAVIGSSLFRNDQPRSLDNAIWLGKSWTYAQRGDGEITDLANRLEQNQIGKIYAYVSTLNISSRWSGGPHGNDSFMQSQDDVVDFRQALKQAYPLSEIYGWIEIWATPGSTGEYRLDDRDFQQNIADFSSRMVEELGFDGILLDVKPLFSGNDDFLQLIRHIRSAVSVDVPIAVAVSPDLTPDDPDVASIASIAPGTMWTAADKQQVMAAADEIVLQLYQSYRDKPLDYIHWVAYHVRTYISLLNEDVNTRILISVPNYQAGSIAHSPSVETIAAALDGVTVGLTGLDEAARASLTGVAIYSDQDLSQEQWNVYQDKWLNR